MLTHPRNQAHTQSPSTWPRLTFTWPGQWLWDWFKWKHVSSITPSSPLPGCELFLSIAPKRNYIQLHSIQFNYSPFSWLPHRSPASPSNCFADDKAIRSAKSLNSIFMQVTKTRKTYPGPVKSWALTLLQKTPITSEERNAPQHAVSTSQDPTITLFPKGHWVNQKRCQEFNTASWIHLLLAMSTKPCSVYTEHWGCSVAQ